MIRFSWQVWFCWRGTFKSIRLPPRWGIPMREFRVSICLFGCSSAECSSACQGSPSMAARLCQPGLAQLPQGWTHGPGVATPHHPDTANLPLRRRNRSRCGHSYSFPVMSGVAKEKTGIFGSFSASPWVSLVAQMVKSLPARQETWFQSLG